MAIHTFPFPHNVRRTILGALGAAALAGTGVAALAGAFTHSGETSAPAVSRAAAEASSIPAPIQPIERPQVTYIVTSDQVSGDLLAQFATAQGLKDIVIRVVASAADRAAFERERMSVGAITDFVVVDTASD